MSHLLRNITVCLLHKRMFLWPSYCTKSIVIVLLIFNQNVQQIVYLPQNQTTLTCVHVCVYTNVRTYASGPCSVCAFNDMLISLITQWVKQCVWEYWPACQPCWPLLWRPLKYLSLLMPGTLTASYISYLCCSLGSSGCQALSHTLLS